MTEKLNMNAKQLKEFEDVMRNYSKTLMPAIRASVVHIIVKKAFQERDPQGVFNGFKATWNVMIKSNDLISYSNRLIREVKIRSTPPSVAEFLLCLFVKRKNRNGLKDCLAEDYETDIASGMSVGRARLRYWGQVLHSILPLMWSSAKRVGMAAIFADLFQRYTK